MFAAKARHPVRIISWKGELVWAAACTSWFVGGTLRGNQMGRKLHLGRRVITTTNTTDPLRWSQSRDWRCQKTANFSHARPRHSSTTTGPGWIQLEYRGKHALT